jgi:hypothetical protein
MEARQRFGCGACYSYQRLKGGSRPSGGGHDYSKTKSGADHGPRKSNGITVSARRIDLLVVVGRAANAFAL